MKKSVYLCLLLLPVSLVFFSCVQFPRRRVEAVTYPRANDVLEWKTPVRIRIAEISLGKTTVFPQAHAELLLETVCQSRGLPLGRVGEGDPSRQKSGGPSLLLDLMIHEESFIRGIDSCRSITAVLSLSDPDTGIPLVRTLYTEESGETIASYYQQYRIVDILVRRFKYEFEKTVDTENHERQ